MEHGMHDPSYFEYRQVTPEAYAAYRIPPYLRPQLPADRNARILDFGCGFGQLMGALVAEGYRNVCGVDVLPAAMEHCRSRGLEVIDGSRREDLLARQGEYSLIVVNHVLEHLEKARIIPLLADLGSLLAKGGALVAMVPNGQSNTGAYWAYEDFTHTTLFTSGSLLYVLRAAGFAQVDFLDVDCTAGLPWFKRIVRRLLLSVYRASYVFWNRVTDSHTHAPSPLIFSYEIKAVARA